MAQTSPFSNTQLLNKRESCAEKLCDTRQLCPTKQRTNLAASETSAPDEMMKSSAITLSPTYTGSSSVLLTDPFCRRVTFSIFANSPIRTSRRVPALIIFVPLPIVPRPVANLRLYALIISSNRQISSGRWR